MSERVKRVKCVKCVESRVLIMTRTEGEAECQVAAGSLGGSCCQASDRLMGELMGLGVMAAGEVVVSSSVKTLYSGSCGGDLWRWCI